MKKRKLCEAPKILFFSLLFLLTAVFFPLQAKTIRDQEILANCFSGQATVIGEEKKYYQLFFYVDEVLIAEFHKLKSGETRSVKWSNFPEIEMARAEPHTFKSVIPGGETKTLKFGGYRCALSVHLLNFSAILENGSVILSWETAEETFTLGYNLYRSETGNSPQEKVNEEMIWPLNYPGAPFGSVYEYTDNNPGNYYWLEELDIFGDYYLYDPIEAY